MKREDLSLLEEPDRGLLDAGSPRGTVGWTPLQYACALGDEELVSSLLAEKPENVTANGQVSASIKHERLTAVRYGHLAIVKLLLASDQIDVDVMDTQIGCTPLHLAVIQGSVAIVRLLLEKQCKSIPSKNGTTPLDLAKELGRIEITQMLTDHVKRQAGTELVDNWLASIGLVEYAPVFHEAGFDDALFILEHGLSDTALNGMNITKIGHRSMLQRLYQLKEFLRERTDELEEEESEEEETDEGESEEEDEGEENESESSNESSEDET